MTSDVGILLSDVNPDASDVHDGRFRREPPPGRVVRGPRVRRTSTRRLREFFPDAVDSLETEQRQASARSDGVVDPSWLGALSAAGIPVCVACGCRNPLHAHRCLDCAAPLRAAVAPRERRLTDSLSKERLPEAPRDRGGLVMSILLLLLAGLGLAFGLGVDWAVVHANGL